MPFSAGDGQEQSDRVSNAGNERTKLRDLEAQYAKVEQLFDLAYANENHLRAAYHRRQMDKLWSIIIALR